MLYVFENACLRGAQLEQLTIIAPRVDGPRAPVGAIDTLRAAWFGRTRR